MKELKTLRELGKVEHFCAYGDIIDGKFNYEEGYQLVDKKNKLEYEEIWYSERELKEEAVKWLNELDHEYRGKEEEGAIEFIVKFFNLTDEDLKENEE